MKQRRRVLLSKNGRTLMALCWICKAEEATTREHRNKRSDIKAVVGDTGPLYLHDDRRLNRKIQSINSKLVKFDPSICNTCNSERARPAVISFALDDPGDLIQQAHDVGSLVMVQVTTVGQAVQAAEHGVDVIVAQGGEAGGYGGSISTMALVPQVVDAVSPIPVVAAGGIYDGRGIAAALMLEAVGVNMGTRFLASKEAPIDDDWKQAIIEAHSEDSVKAEVLNDIIPVPGTVGYGTVGRTLRTPFFDEWSAKRDEARQNGERLWTEIVDRLRRGQRRETLVWAGQTAGGVREILPVAEIMRRLVDETEAALARAPALH
jgi:enoyl-[acyl-carrier protein] reductase II